MMHLPAQGEFYPSQVSQTPVALGQLAIFNPSQMAPIVTGQKVQETPMALGFVTGVTGKKGQEREKRK
jgi:hypothetical protein